jgi:hypothetical protein
MDDHTSETPNPTIAVLGYFSTILAGEVLIGTVLLRTLRQDRLPLHVDLTLIGVAGLLTVFGWWRRDDFHHWRSTRGRISITKYQGLLVTILLTSIVCMFAYAISS